MPRAAQNCNCGQGFGQNDSQNNKNSENLSTFINEMAEIKSEIQQLKSIILKDNRPAFSKLEQRICNTESEDTASTSAKDRISSDQLEILPRPIWVDSVKSTQPSTSNNYKSILTDILAISKAKYIGKNRKQSKNRGKTAILTSPDYINELKEEKVQEKVKKPKIDKERKVNKNCGKKILKGKISQKKKALENKNEEASCSVCDHLFNESEPGEMWIQCAICEQWFHETCVSISKKILHFVCKDYL